MITYKLCKFELIIVRFRW